MKKAIFALILTSVALHAQTSPQNSNSYVAGRFVAYNYGQWRSGIYSLSAPGPGSITITVTNAFITLPDGRKMMPYSTTAPLRIGTETATPSAVSNCVLNDPSPTNCQITVTVSNAHTTADTVSSGTFGLQEALNDASGPGGVVTIDGSWAAAGGTTTIKNAATVPSGTAIEDVRTTVAGGGLSGMTAGQIPVAATASTVTSSKALAGSGAGITTGPTSSTNLDCANFAGTGGQIQDSGSPCGTGSGGAGLAQLGTITSAQTWTSGTLSANYTASGTNGTPTVEAAGTGNCPGSPSTNACLLYNATGTNANTDVLSYDGSGHTYYTNLYYWQHCTTNITGTESSTSYGFGTGLYTWFGGVAGGGGGGADVFANIDLTNTGTSGQLTIWTRSASSTAVLSATSKTNMTIANGDSITVCVKRTLDLIDAKVTNNTTSQAPVEVSLQYSIQDSIGPTPPSVSKFAVYNQGGVLTLTSDVVTSEEPVGGQLAVFGDSKGVSFTASFPGFPTSTLVGTYGQGWFNSLPVTSLINDSADGLGTADAVRLLPELVSLAPKTVIINVGRNDGATWGATQIANYQNIQTTLSGAGITAYCLQNIWEPGLNQSQEITWLQANCTGNLIDPGIDSAVQTWAVTTVHPLLPAQDIIRQNVINFLQSKSFKFNAPTYQNLPVYAPYVNTPFLFAGGLSTQTSSIRPTAPSPVSLGCAACFGSFATAPVSGSVLPVVTGVGVSAATAGPTIYRADGVTNDSSTPAYFKSAYAGSATAANRQWNFQTYSGSAFNGIMAFQNQGGVVSLSGGGGQTWIGNITSGSFSGLTQISSGQTAATTSTGIVAELGESTDGVATLRLEYAGSATASARVWSLNPFSGGFNQGILSLAPAAQVIAPTVTSSDNSTNVATTAFVKVQAYAPLASPTFTGTPAAPTAAVGTSTTQLATTAFVATGFSPALATAPTGTATFTAGTNITSCGCASGYTCTNTRGELTIVGGTATTGTICTVNFSTTLGTAPGMAIVTQNGGTSAFDVGHGQPSTASMTVTAGLTVVGATLTVDYLLLP